MQRGEEVLPGPGRILKACKAETGEACAGPDFEELFFEHYPRLVRALTRLTGNSAQAEELAADAFCKLHERGRGGAGENPAGWLYRTAMNLGLDALRANSRRQKREEKAGVLNESAASPLDQLLAEEDRARVRKVISELKPIHGQVLLMGSCGFPAKEIGAVLGLKPESVYTLIVRARAQFEKKYVRFAARNRKSWPV